jgi:MFS family permease
MRTGDANVADAVGMFRGWYVAGAAFIVTFIGFGTAYTFSAFLEPLQTEFGASRGSVSIVFSLAGFLYFALGAVTGPMADRWGARRLVVFGMILTGAGLLVASQARTLTEVYLAYVLGIGLGVGCAYVPALGAVQRWFDKQRAAASGLAVAGIGVGTLVLPPLATLLIAAFGWREAYLMLGGFAAAVGGAAALMLEDDPRHCGLERDGKPASSIAPTDGDSDSPVGAKIRSREFWILYGTTLLCSLGAFVPFVHLVPYAVEHGIARTSAALLVGAIGVGSTVARFFLGALADRIGRVRALVLMSAGMGGTLIIWGVSSDAWALASFAVLFGAFYGGWVAVLPTVVVDLFGSHRIGSAIGILYTSVALGTLVGPALAGWAFDTSGSYSIPIAGAVVADVAAALIVGLTLG